MLYGSRPDLALLAAAAVMLMAGCKGSSIADPGAGARARVTLNKQSYAPGEQVDARLTNLTDVTLDYSSTVCYMTLERRDGSAWIPVTQRNTVCRMGMMLLAPRQSLPFPYRLAPGLAAGTYRLSFPEPTPADVTIGGSPAPTLTTIPFTVASGP